MITIYRVVAAYLLVAVLLGQLMPLVVSVLPPQVVAAYNETGMNLTSTFAGNKGVFTTVMQQSFGSSLANGTATNNTGTGFFSGITIFSGLAFVFSTIGYVMEALLNVPRGMLVLMNVAMTSTGLPIVDATMLTYLFYAFITLAFVLTGISSWMKYDLKNG